MNGGGVPEVGRGQLAANTHHLRHMLRRIRDRDHSHNLQQRVDQVGDRPEVLSAMIIGTQSAVQGADTAVMIPNELTEHRVRDLCLQYLIGRLRADREKDDLPLRKPSLLRQHLPKQWPANSVVAIAKKTENTVITPNRIKIERGVD